MLRAHRVVNSRLFDLIPRADDEDELEPRPRLANPVQARFLDHFLRYELGAIADRRREGEQPQAPPAEVQQEQFLAQKSQRLR